MQWAEEGKEQLKKKGLGKGIMVSVWMDSKGILTLTPEQWEMGKQTNPTLQQKAFFMLKFGRVWGYYDWAKFEQNTLKAMEIAEIIYPGKTLVFLYDHSSVHKKRGDDADEK